MKIGKYTLCSNALFAPMAGLSDIGARYLARKYGAGLTYTEMVSAKGLIYNNRQTQDLLTLAENDTPSAVQLFASRPEDIMAAIRLLPPNVDIVDINMGCPVPKVVKNGEGSALMKDSGRAAELVAGAVSASDRPITVKMRTGWSRDSITAVEVAKAVEKAGAAAITVHGRTREDMYSGEVDYDTIRRVKDSVSIPVIGNGDVKSFADYHNMIALTQVDGVMIGRGAVGNYKLFSAINGTACEADTCADIHTHIKVLQTIYPDKVVANLMKMHISYYAAGFRGAKAIREQAHAASNIGDIEAVIELFFNN